MKKYEVDATWFWLGVAAIIVTQIHAWLFLIRLAQAAV